MQTKKVNICIKKALHCLDYDMEHINVIGRKELKGNIDISGSKNSALPILASSILSDKPQTFTNIPNLVDINSMIALLKSLGVAYKIIEKAYVLNASSISSVEAKYNLVSKMRASFLVLGPLLSREGRAKVSLPGGCAIGTRPVDLHIYAMKRLGAEIDIKDGYILAKSPKKGLIGNSINFSNISVGATENALMAAFYAKGETVIKNAAKEPEIIDLCESLIGMGAKISGVGTSNIFIQGVTGSSSNNHKVIADRIEACTYMIVAAITKSNLTIENINPKFIKQFLKVMKDMGVIYKILNNRIEIFKGGGLKPIKIDTEEYPGFPTDMQAQLLTMACLSDGVSEIRENIFENRFMHVPELNRLGADIKIDGNKAIVQGNRSLVGAEVMATDLRASVSLVLAGLVAKGRTKINRIYHLDRGYDNIEGKLKNSGALIERGYD